MLHLESKVFRCLESQLLIRIWHQLKVRILTTFVCILKTSYPEWNFDNWNNPEYIGVMILGEGNRHWPFEGDSLSNFNFLLSGLKQQALRDDHLQVLVLVLVVRKLEFENCRHARLCLRLGEAHVHVGWLWCLQIIGVVNHNFSASPDVVGQVLAVTVLSVRIELDRLRWKWIPESDQF